MSFRKPTEMTRRSFRAACLLVAVTGVTAASGEAGKGRLDGPAPQDPPACPTDGSTLFTQEPELDDWMAVLSEVDWSTARYENFHDLGGRIAGIRFWGLNSYADTFGWTPCFEAPMDFEITFYDDGGDGPGPEVCSYTVSAAPLVVGSVGYLLFDVLEYDAELDPPCVLRDGWVSVTGAGLEDCWFLWLVSTAGDGQSWHQDELVPYDLSLCLTTDGVEVYGACCDDFTGVCEEEAAMSVCAGRFIPAGLCEDFEPDCGGVVGACCYPDGPCEVVSHAACANPGCPGDLNCDGLVDSFDIDPLVVALSDPAAYEAQYPECDISHADVNADGITDYFDIDPFIALLGTSCDEPAGTWWGAGSTCDVCPPLPIVVPDDLPFVDVNHTCGRENLHDETCLDMYDGGAEIVYELTVLDEAIGLEITLDPLETLWAGVLLDDSYPPDDDCIAASVHAGRDPYPLTLGCKYLEPGTYYVMIDTWPEPACIEEFELLITACDPPIGRCCYEYPAPCAEITEAACLSLGGEWDVSLDCTTPCGSVDGESCDNPMIVPLVPYARSLYTDAMTADGPAAPCDKYAPSGAMRNDAWFVWTAGVDGLATASVVGTDDERDLVLVVRAGCEEGAALACADSQTGAFETLSFPATAGATYYLQIGDVGTHSRGGLTTFALDIATGSGACCFSDGSCLLLSGLDCAEQDGAYQGDGADCATAECRQPAPGDNCDDPLPVTLDAASLPFVDTNSTTGRGDDYAVPCLGSFESGEDIVYELTVTETIAVDIELDPKGTEYAGMVLSDACPPGDNCIARSVDLGPRTPRIEQITLGPGVYYLLIDKSFAPYDIPEFDLTVSVNPYGPPEIGACCLPADYDCISPVTPAECHALGGGWYWAEDCSDFECPSEGGENCGDPIVINLPAELPYEETDTTCGRGDHYRGTDCLAGFDGGQDIVCELLVTDEVCVDIHLNSWDGLAFMAVSDTCPGGEPCTTGYYAIEDLTLAPGVHYLVIDTWFGWDEPSDCTAFDLTIKACEVGP